MRKNAKKHEILLATGGTGGHIFPAQALAESLASDFKISLVIDRRGAKFLQGALLSVDKEEFNISAFRGTLLNKCIAISQLILSFVTLFFKFFKKKPVLVIGFGGYASIPAICSAFLHRIPIIIHEQNSVIGKANKLLSKLADVVAISFKKTYSISDIPSYKIVYTGNPIRNQILALRDRDHKKLDRNVFRILILGGSQGSALFSDIIPKAVEILDPKIQSKLFIFQQVRNENLTSTVRSYNSTKAKVEIKVFFKNIEDLLYKCDLVIARSGATTVTEIMEVKKPAIFIPFAAAAQNHQFFNAKFLEEQGAAIIIEEKFLDPQKLADILLNLLIDKEKFAKMQLAMKKIKIQNTSSEFTALIHKTLKRLN